MHHAFEAMRRAGFVHVELEARESNTAARGFYSHLGMIEVGRIARY
ncbi:MAG: GNAT family N-acetyltransferase [Candidatus Thorarchaeota archaeon]